MRYLVYKVYQTQTVHLVVIKKWHLSILPKQSILYILFSTWNEHKIHFHFPKWIKNRNKKVLGDQQNGNYWDFGEFWTYSLVEIHRWTSLKQSLWVRKTWVIFEIIRLSLSETKTTYPRCINNAKSIRKN